MTNLKKILKQFNRRYFWGGILVGSIVCLLVFISVLVAYPSFEGVVLVFTMVIVFLIFLVIYLIQKLVRSSAIQNAIKKQGEIASFNQDNFQEVCDSKHFFVGKDWLVWRKGYQYRFFHRDHLQNFEKYATSNPGNDYGLLNIYTDKGKVSLPYDIIEGMDVAVYLNQWLHPVTEEVLDELVCPECFEVNCATAKFCRNCGTKLV